MVRINPLESMTTPLPVRCDPNMPAVNASSGTSARSLTTDRLIASKSGPDILLTVARPGLGVTPRFVGLGAPIGAMVDGPPWAVHQNSTLSLERSRQVDLEAAARKREVQRIAVHEARRCTAARVTVQKVQRPMVSDVLHGHADLAVLEDAAQGTDEVVDRRVGRAGRAESVGA